MTSVRQYSSSGKHLADGERSMLALFKEAAEKYENEREGILVPFNAFYSALDDFIDHTHRIVISQASRNSRLNPFDVEVLKVLFMIKHVNNFKSNVENVATLMISSMTEDILELRKKVDASFRVLANEGVVQKNGDEYTFLTNEEQDAENVIRTINIDPKDTVNYVASVAFEEAIALTNNKYKYNNRYQFGFNQQIDDRVIRSNPANHLTLHLLTAYCGKDDDLSLGLLSADEKSVVVRMSDDYAYLTETESMKKVEAFLGKPDLANLTNYEVIRINKQKERNDRVKRISDYVRMALESADIYVRGEKVTTKAKDVVARINEAFGKLVASEFSKLGDMETAPEASDIQNMLKKTKAQMTLNLPGMREENADALRELLAKVQEAERYGRIYSIKQALTDFEDAPYGYTELDVEYLIATLYKKGQIALKMNSVIYSPASTNPDDAYKYITKKEYREKISLAMKEIPKTQWIKSVKTVITDFLGRTVVTDDTDVLMRDFRGYAQTKKASMQILLREEYQKNEKLPGKKLLEKSVRLMDDVLQINDPMTFYKRVDELYGDFDEAAEGLADLTAFLEGAQKDKFNKACFVLSIFKKSENYISDADVIGYAKQVERLINLPEPYNFINKLEEFAIRLQNAITELLEKDAKRIEPDVYADRKIAVEAVLEDRPYADIVSKKINQKFEALLDKLKRTNDIAALNGIPSESNALLENCLADIKNEEAAYQRAQVQQQPSGDKTKEKPDVTPVKVIHTEPITMRTLTRGKSYSIKDSDDVEAFLQEIRRELMAKLGDDKVIKLS